MTTLTIDATNSPYIITIGDTYIIQDLQMASDTKLIINGTLRFEDNATLSDFIMLALIATTTFFTNSATIHRIVRILIRRNIIQLLQER